MIEKIRKSKVNKSIIIIVCALISLALIFIFLKLHQTKSNDIAIKRVVTTPNEDYGTDDKWLQIKIDDAMKNSNIGRLNEFGLLDEHRQLKTSNQQKAIKFIDKYHLTSSSIESLSTEALMKDFDKLNSNDRLIHMLAVISRGKFDHRFNEQLKLVNKDLTNERNQLEAKIKFQYESNQSVDKSKQKIGVN